MENTVFTAWIVSHPTLLVAGMILGRLCPPGGVIQKHVGALRTAAITFGVCFLYDTMAMSGVGLGYGPLCCFCSGATCGITRRKSDLWPAMSIVVLFGAGLIAVAVLWVFN